MKSRILLIALFAFIFTGNLFASEGFREKFGGAWFGYITQTPAGLAERYFFQIYLEEIDGEISGQSYIALEEDDAYGIMNISCEIVDGAIQITELEIVDEQLYAFAYWCQKAYLLFPKLENGIQVLEGEWESDYCGGTTGSIHLERRLS